MELGVCYYPEHWPKETWSKDIRKMWELGIRWVRIGEFAWSRLEPEAGHYRWEWLDDVLQLFHQQKIQVVLGTPTATPPIWMVEKYPDLYAWDEAGRPRKFGSRRHYCFSHLGYRKESEKICGKLAERYGTHPAVQAWQTDNEYGCHDTVRSYSPHAKIGFQKWLEEKYRRIETLNQAWGNAFWSMEYQNFSQIDCPHLTVTEANPAHRMDFLHYSSDQVIEFNRIQVEAIREHSQYPIIHNFMGQFLDFDHYRLAENLEIASWDSYPLGFLALQHPIDGPPQPQTTFYRQGDPDFQALHHELYHQVGKGRFWVMEQQPGPVNWAPYNPIPLQGMVRLWTWEAFFHGAEVVSYFRWRQAARAQEQMHAGLLSSDGEPQPVVDEITQIMKDLTAFQFLSLRPLENDNEPPKKKPKKEPKRKLKPLGIVFDYAAAWMWEIQPPGPGFGYLKVIQKIFKILRQKGFLVSIVSPYQSSWQDYQAVFLPALHTLSTQVSAALEENQSLPKEKKIPVIFGPRCGCKTPTLSNQNSLDFISTKIVELATLPNSVGIPCYYQDQWIGKIQYLFEKLQTNPNAVIWKTDEGLPALIKKENLFYLAGVGDDAFLAHLIDLLSEDVPTLQAQAIEPLSSSFCKLLERESENGFRICPHRNHPELILCMNYGDKSIDISKEIKGMEVIVGDSVLSPGDITILKQPNQ